MDGKGESRSSSPNLLIVLVVVLRSRFLGCERSTGCFLRSRALLLGNASAETNVHDDDEEENDNEQEKPFKVLRGWR
jgi:hypothetical protein